MKIHFSTEGGFAGITRRFSDDVEILPQEIKAGLKLLTDQKEKYSALPVNENARDMMTYKLMLELENGSLNFEFNELNLPEELEELIHYCSLHAQVNKN